MIYMCRSLQSGELFLLAKSQPKYCEVIRCSFSHSISDDFEQWKNQQRMKISFDFVHLKRANERRGTQKKKGEEKPPVGWLFSLIATMKIKHRTKFQ